MIFSEDNRIGLRAIEREDLPQIKVWRNNEDLRRNFREYREFSDCQKEGWYESMVGDNRFEMFVIEDVEEKQLVGVAGITYIDWVNRHGDVHFYIGKEGAWIDEVYSPTAIQVLLEYGFETLNLNKLWAEIYEVDVKKLEFFKGLGFKVDASLREHYFFKGRYYTSHILSLLRNEFWNE